MTVPELMNATGLAVATVRRAVRKLLEGNEIQFGTPKWRDGNGNGYFQYEAVESPPGGIIPAANPAVHASVSGKD